MIVSKDIYKKPLEKPFHGCTRKYIFLYKIDKNLDIKIFAFGDTIVELIYTSNDHLDLIFMKSFMLSSKKARNGQ